MKNTSKENKIQSKKHQMSKKPLKPPISDAVKKIYRLYCFMVVTTAIFSIFTSTVFAAATDNPLTVINNLSDFIFGIIRAVGMILLGFGIVQIGLALKSHDPSQRANGFLTLTGGVIITFSKEILNIITGA